MIKLTNPTSLNLFRQATQTRQMTLRHLKTLPPGLHPWRVNDLHTLITFGEFGCPFCQDPVESPFIMLFRKYANTHQLLRVWDTSTGEVLDVTRDFSHPHIDTSGLICMGNAPDPVIAITSAFNPRSAYGSFHGMVEFFYNLDHFCDAMHSYRCTKCESFASCSYSREDEGYLCPSCYQANYFRCDHCEEDCANEDAWFVARDQTVCDFCFDHYYSKCEECEEYYLDEELTEAPIKSGNYHCEPCLHRHFNWCDDCEDYYDEDNHCPNCEIEEEEEEEQEQNYEENTNT